VCVARGGVYFSFLNTIFIACFRLVFRFWPEITVTISNIDFRFDCCRFADNGLSTRRATGTRQQHYCADSFRSESSGERNACRPTQNDGFIYRPNIGMFINTRVRFSRCNETRRSLSVRIRRGSSIFRLKLRKTLSPLHAQTCLSAKRARGVL